MVPYVQLQTWLPALVVLRDTESLVRTLPRRSVVRISTGRRIAKGVSLPSSTRRFARPACMRDCRRNEEESTRASQRDAKML